MNWEAGTPCAVVEPTAGYNLASRWASWAEVCSGVADQLLKDELEASNILLEEFLTGLISVKKKKKCMWLFCSISDVKRRYLTSQFFQLCTIVWICSLWVQVSWQKGNFLSNRFWEWDFFFPLSFSHKTF